MMRFEISRRARRQIDRIHAWWTDNRPAARSMFLDELDQVERLLRANPEAGITCAKHRSGVVRRVLLTRTEYHLYYQFRAERNEIVVLSVWGATRGRGPKL
jgi:plasmid stabilization system protein ParE